MKDQVFIAEPTVSSAISNLISAQPSSVALIGEKGSGKYYTCRYIASGLIKSKLSLDNNPAFIRIDAAENGIEDIREIQKELSYSVPGNSTTRRILVIEHFDSFGHAAQNSMLKTLEEPPQNTMIIVTVENESQVLPTILSRVQSIRITPLSYETAAKNLAPYDEAALYRAFLMSGGLAGLMISLLKENADHELVNAIVQAKDLLQMPKFKRVASVETLVKKPDVPVLLLMDGLIRVLEASYKQAVKNNSSLETLKSTHQRLKTAILTVDDINHGLNQKLALTRLFLAL